MMSMSVIFLVAQVIALRHFHHLCGHQTIAMRLSMVWLTPSIVSVWNVYYAGHFLSWAPSAQDARFIILSCP
jgi:hypothetical protein